MDELFGEIIGCGIDSDSIMLRLLRSAMDKAHENVQSTDGFIELLIARSKFYELAMILVKGCSKLIEEKADIPESNREKMLSDLMESRDMVRGRLKELKLGIVDKDRELMERLENEFKLRQAMELKEMELVSLRAELERRKSKGIPDNKEGDICELKNSVDQQVWSIKQKLEDERICLTTGTEFYGSEAFEETPMSPFSRPEESVIIEQMSSDIDGLKGTLDLAFGRMERAETRPLEKQWRWTVEKDTILILIGGFISNFQDKLNCERDDSRLQTAIMEEIYLILSRGLVNDLYLKFDSDEIERRIKDDICMCLFTEMVNEWKIRLETKSLENSLTEDIYKVFFGEKIKEWEMESDAAKLENLIREEMHNLVIAEAVKDANINQETFDKRTEESLTWKLDSLLKCFEVGEDLMLRASMEIREHSTRNDCEALECEEVDERRSIKWLLTEEETTFSSVSQKLDRALQHLFISKALLVELQDNFHVAAVGGVGGRARDEQPSSLFRWKEDCILKLIKSADSVFSPLLEFQQMLVGFERSVDHKLEMNFMRLKKLADQIHQLTQLVAPLRKSELLYRKAFSRRCHNLRLAETEVDLLGDQVDALLGLLEKIYLALDQYSPVLSRYFRVVDILKLIKKELTGVAAHTTQLPT